MKNYLLVKRLFLALALLLSHTMCIVVAYSYGNWDTHLNSAPVEVNLLYMVPFVIGIGICLLVAWLCQRKACK